MVKQLQYLSVMNDGLEIVVSLEGVQYLETTSITYLVAQLKRSPHLKYFRFPWPNSLNEQEEDLCSLK